MDRISRYMTFGRKEDTPRRDCGACCSICMTITFWVNIITGQLGIYNNVPTCGIILPASFTDVKPSSSQASCKSRNL